MHYFGSLTIETVDKFLGAPVGEGASYLITHRLIVAAARLWTALGVYRVLSQ